MKRIIIFTGLLDAALWIAYVIIHNQPMAERAMTGGAVAFLEWLDRWTLMNNLSFWAAIGVAVLFLILITTDRLARMTERKEKPQT